MLTITRFAYMPEGTYGHFALNGQRLVTVERPWLNNTPNISCIPGGTYNCIPAWYNRGGYRAIEVEDEPGRTYILFHVGNSVHNSQGCILVNSWHEYTEAGIVGANSRTAFDLFMAEYGNEPFTLTINNFSEVNNEILLDTDAVAA